LTRESICPLPLEVIVFKYLVPIGIVLYLLKLSGFCFSQFEWKANRE
jgi:hypothetical protein